MDKGVVQEKVSKLAPVYQIQFGLEKWEIRYSYDTTLTDDNGTVYGNCSAAYDYNDASITLNPEAFKDDKDLEGTVRHELFHVVLSPFDLFSECVSTIELDDNIKKLLGRVLTNAREKAVTNLERMYQGLTKQDEPSLPLESSV